MAAPVTLLGSEIARPGCTTNIRVFRNLWLLPDVTA